ncbi:TPA: glycoside hydrolase family 39, partial [Klebsiella pneumoniae]|nr:glycoside hydrolase family 39 [Klebsiella pneumoniae]
GINGSPNDSHLEQFNIKWVRIDFSWKNIEKAKGVYQWKKYDDLITEAHNKGYILLPILGYTPTWGTNGGQSSPPTEEKDWTDFISAVVNRYSRAPYNIKYYQIWNEPTKKAGFWKGSNEQFIDSIYIPAAKIIKKHGGKVVFGGWPISNSMSELVQILKISKAYTYTDIISFHYRSETGYREIYDNFIKNGPVAGIWQTEIGYTDKKYFLLTKYSKILSWVIDHDWNEKDKYKLFWYPFFSNRPNFQKAIYAANENKQFITNNGKELKIFLEVYTGGELQSIKSWTNDTISINKPFAVNVKGKKIVYAIFIDGNELSEKNIHYINKPGINVSSAEIYCANGKRTQYFDYSQDENKITLHFKKNIIKSICGDSAIYYTILKY